MGCRERETGREKIKLPAETTKRETKRGPENISENVTSLSLLS